jgi:solute carrier family 44 protein 1 (choline transporter-like protein)
MVITLVKILRMIVDSLRNQARESGNPFAQILAACLSCILGIIEDFLKYLIRNAYIIVAKDGTPLIESGRKAFKLIWDNLKDVVALNHFGDLVLIVARIFVFAISTFIAYEIMKSPEVKNVWIPVVLAGIFSFLIAHCFITVFEMTVDTIFICFCDDFIENDGASRPYFMSPELMDVMRKLKEEAGGDFNFGGGDYNPQERMILPHDPQPSYPPPQAPHGLPYPTQPMYPNQPQQGFYPPLPPNNQPYQQPSY